MVRCPPALIAGALASVGLAVASVVGCGSGGASTSDARIPPALLREARPIGRGPRFRPAARGALIGHCRHSLGAREGVHVELFAANRVVIVPAGIGSRPPLHHVAGRIAGARCFGDVVTLEPTGVVLVRSGRRLTLGTLFRAWGQPLSRRRLAGFEGTVSAFVGGRRWLGALTRIPLRRHEEIVLETGPHVPPHRSYTFPPGV